MRLLLAIALAANALPGSFDVHQGKGSTDARDTWSVRCTNCSGVDGGATTVSGSVSILDGGALHVVIDGSTRLVVNLPPAPKRNPVTGAAVVEGLALSSIDGKLPALSSGRVPVDGSGVTQPVSGPLTDTQLRASPVPITANAPGLQVQLPVGAATDATLSALLDGGVVMLVRAPGGQNLPALAEQSGTPIVTMRAPPPLNPFLPRCNPVRRTGCQP